MADQGDQLAVATSLNPQDAKAILGVLVGDPLGGVTSRGQGESALQLTANFPNSCLVSETSRPPAG